MDVIMAADIVLPVHDIGTRVYEAVLFFAGTDLELELSAAGALPPAGERQRALAREVLRCSDPVLGTLDAESGL